MKILGHTYSPAEKANEHATLTTISCKLEGHCPLLAEGKCAHVRILGPGCVYGSTSRQQTKTKRSKGYGAQAAELKRTRDAQPAPQLMSTYDDKIRRIGDYVHLPYHHMNHIDGKEIGIPFLGYSHFMSFGSPFMKAEDFTPDVIIKLITFTPQALFGGGITSYNTEVVPRFVGDLREFDPALFEAVALIFPAIREIAELGESRWIPFKDCPKDAFRIQIEGFEGEFMHYKHDGHIEGKVKSLGMGIPTTDEMITVQFNLNPETKIRMLDRDLEVKFNRKRAASAR